MMKFNTLWSPVLSFELVLAPFDKFLFQRQVHLLCPLCFWIKYSFFSYSSSTRYEDHKDRMNIQNSTLDQMHFKFDDMLTTRTFQPHKASPNIFRPQLILNCSQKLKPLAFFSNYE